LHTKARRRVGRTRSSGHIRGPWSATAADHDRCGHQRRPSGPPASLSRRRARHRSPRRDRRPYERRRRDCRSPHPRTRRRGQSRAARPQGSR
jgi:hypothetical protein